jgi:hypothetical protein
MSSIFPSDPYLRNKTQEIKSNSSGGFSQLPSDLPSDFSLLAQIRKSPEKAKIKRNVSIEQRNDVASVSRLETTKKGSSVALTITLPANVPLFSSKTEKSRITVYMPGYSGHTDVQGTGPANVGVILNGNNISVDGKKTHIQGVLEGKSDLNIQYKGVNYPAVLLAVNPNDKKEIGAVVRLALPKNYVLNVLLSGSSDQKNKQLEEALKNGWARLSPDQTKVVFWGVQMDVGGGVRSSGTTNQRDLNVLAAPNTSKDLNHYYNHGTTQGFIQPIASIPVTYQKLKNGTARYIQPQNVNNIQQADAAKSIQNVNLEK